jgi:hypothetical protein
MKQTLFMVFIALALSSCNMKNAPYKTTTALQYAYKATYSSDITVPSHPEYAQMVLKIWKMFESAKIDSMRQYYANTVTYDPPDGQRFHGKKDDLLNYAAKDISGLDSMRFDISTWQSVHINDKNEDWVYIWATERRYAKDGTADTFLMQEQWQIINHKVAYFNLYRAAPVKNQ